MGSGVTWSVEVGRDMQLMEVWVLAATETGDGLDNLGVPSHGAERCRDGAEPAAGNADELPGNGGCWGVGWVGAA